MVAPADLDLGDLWEERDYQRELPIHNRTGADIHIADFSVSCGCIAVEPRSLNVPAGQTAKVHLTLDLSKRTPWSLGVAERPLNLQVFPVLGPQGPSADAWVLVGKIHSRVTLDAQTLEFGDAPVQGQTPVVRKVAATAHVPIRELAVEARPPLADIQMSRDSADPSKYVLAVSPKPTLPPGRFQFELIVDAVGPEGERLPGAQMTVRGDMQPEVRALPSRLLLGSRPVGETAEAVVVLQIPAGSGWTVDHLETESSQVEVKVVAAPAVRDGSAFQVRQVIAREGDHSSTVRFFIRKPGQDPTVLSMEVAYHGEAAVTPSETGTKGK